MDGDRTRARGTLRGPAVAAALLSLALLPTSHVARAADGDGDELDLGALEAESGDLGALGAEDEGAPSLAEESLALGDVEDLDAGSGVRVQTICTNCNAASLTVNGMSGPHVQVYWDDIPTEGGLGTVYMLTQVPGDLIGYSKVYRGPGSVLTGSEGIAGSIRFNTVKRDRRRALLDLQLGDWGWKNLKLVGGDQWGPVGALVYVQGALWNWTDASGDGAHDVADIERATYQGLFDFHLTDHQTVTVQGLFYGEDQADGPGAPVLYVPQPPEEGEPYWRYLHEDAYFNWRRYSVQWELARPDGLRLTAGGRYSRRGQQQWAAPYPGDPVIWTYLIEDEQSYLSFQAEAPVGAAGFLTGGITWKRQRLSVKQQNVGFQPWWIADGLEELGGYLQYDRSLGGGWDLSVGARYDILTVFGQTWTQPLNGDPPFTEAIDDIERSFLLPRLQLSWRPSAKAVLTLAAGRGLRGPRPVFESTCCGAAYQRNIGLPPERSWSYQAALELKPTPDQRFTTTLFWTDFSDYHERIVYESAGYIPHYSNREIAEATIHGIDFIHDMRFAENRINVGWTYTYTHAEAESPVMGEVPVSGDLVMLDEAGSRLRYVPRHAASAYLRYDDPRRGTKVDLDVAWQGSVTHFDIAAMFRAPHREWEFLSSESFMTVSLRFEQRIRQTGWSAYVGVDNATDYVMEDLGRFGSAYDWGPITGRFVHAGVKFKL